MNVKPNIIIKDDPTILAVAAAEIFTRSAKESISRKDSFTVAISGGSTPRTTHRLLAEEPYCSDIPWEKIHIFWVDERCVPKDDEASNYGAVEKDLLDKIPIYPDHVHLIPVEDPPEESAMRYQEELMEFFQLEKSGVPAFDLIFLGIGKDGHTASLFPGHEALEEDKRLIVAVNGGDPCVSRITMTYLVINHARQIVFMVSGKGKSQVLKTVFENRKDLLPAQRVRPSQGKMIWLLDKEAASLVN
ncbi:6-phosphogluconolactonase [Thermodesulfobacteriota bacterium]